MRRGRTKSCNITSRFMITHHFEIYRKSEKHGTSIKYGTGLFSIYPVSAEAYIDAKTVNRDPELLALLMFIGSSDLSLNRANFISISPPSSELFNFMASYGFSPRLEENIHKLVAEQVLDSKSAIDLYECMTEYNALMDKYEDFGWASYPLSSCTVPTDWFYESKSPNYEVWSCPSEVLQENLKINVYEWFDCDSAV
ncbi:hypothetical protein [Candidatus Sororendozoicomonas aggregata]|uniref:hypothetical protein n=1 Tax=Candidatus Sororendozoicomonas aggregata TaxID=3073239 RepID=UPI002ED0D7AD